MLGSARRFSRSWLLAGLCLLPALVPATAQSENGKLLPDLTGFKTVATAQTTKIAKGAGLQTASPGYLGVQAIVDAKDQLIVSDVDDQSPAALAGLRSGDILLKMDGQPLDKIDVFRSLLQTKFAGEQVKLTVQRQSQKMEVTVSLTATSRILHVGKQRAIMGVQLDDTKDGVGTLIKQVTPGMPAEKAGLKAGDIILKVDDRALSATVKLADFLAEKSPGDLLTLLIKREGADKEKKIGVRLTAEEKRFGGKGGKSGKAGWDNRTLGMWNKDVYRLAIVGIEYPDVKHNEKITPEQWEDALFSTKTYVKVSATGQKTHGSLNDYYQEQSFGKLKVQGSFFSYVQVSKKRAEYAQATGLSKVQLLTEALDKLYARDGKDALQDFDGIFFLYAGERVQTNRGGLYWPHRATVTHKDKRWPYFIVQEGGQRMGDISLICHEFGHLLGLPDLYARPENPGSEGAGQWCAMSMQVPGGRPQHFSAWSKEQLGWIQPALIDPTEKQKLILAPIEDSAKECYKILVRPDGSEYFLLENRRKKGFDQSVPAEGLLIWRIVGNRPILEESHGVEGPQGPNVFPESVPYPSSSNKSFTPYTMPSSRSQLGGGLPVHITNIRRLPDGRITFYIGYEFF